MAVSIQIVPIVPFDDGVAEGAAVGKQSVLDRTAEMLRDAYVRDTLGAMSREALARQIVDRLEAEPDYSTYPELADIYPERVDYLRGFAQGAGCSRDEAAVYDYLAYRLRIDRWYNILNPTLEPGHCSGVLLVGADGVLGAHSIESGTKPRPAGYVYREPAPYPGLKSIVSSPRRFVFRKPRTGYIESWGVSNEMGLGCTSATSCSTWLDEPIEDVWPIKAFPLLRFARDVGQLVELYTRYRLHVFGRESQIWADTSGDAAVFEKSFRRVGVRRMDKSGVLWCTEGHFESLEMFTYLREKRLDYLRRTGKHLGSGDMQYATDCAVRFTRLGELCHMPWGRGYEHMRRILTDHAPFPRAVCRHCGPDTAPYDQTVTQESRFNDLTHNRSFRRRWVPWKSFACEVPEHVREYPPRPWESATVAAKPAVASA